MRMNLPLSVAIASVTFVAAGAQAFGRRPQVAERINHQL